MKALLIFALTLFSSLSFAGDKYICREINNNTYQLKKMILTQVGDASMKEGKFYPFKLEIFDKTSSTPIYVEAVNVRIEDVMVKITNTAKKVSGIIFLDEMEATWIKIGKTSISFDCN